MTPQQASEKYHWIKFNPDKNIVEMYLDNYMLSSARLCEASFFLEHLLWIKPRYDSKSRKPWFFDFGEWLHYSLELFYDNFKKQQKPPIIDEWLPKCKEYWEKMKMDEYGAEDYPNKTDYTKYHDIKGWEGAAGLLIQYYAYYMDLRVRVVDTEITFGHNKEVLLGKFLAPYKIELREKGRLKRIGRSKIQETTCLVECFLTGRIDLLVDNGYKIGPVDHKSTHIFDGYEHLDFNPQDGITGYILTINELLESYRKKGLTNIPISGGGWIYHIQAKRPTDPDKKKGVNKGKVDPRFKITPVDKTKQQLDDYKARQLSTFKRIADLLFNDKVPEWNTTNCNNMFFRPCQFRPIHEQPSTEWPRIINSFYQITTPWDTRNMAHHKDNKEEKKEEEKEKENVTLADSGRENNK